MVNHQEGCQWERVGGGKRGDQSIRPSPQSGSGIGDSREHRSESVPRAFYCRRPPMSAGEGEEQG
jgi:hypothetical protein